jgi:hypothetical protein
MSWHDTSSSRSRRRLRLSSSGVVFYILGEAHAHLVGEKAVGNIAVLTFIIVERGR